MIAILQSVLALVAQLAGSSANAALVAKIIDILLAVIPVVVQEYKDLLPIVQNIIVALKADPATTADQLAKLQALELVWDADFEAAANAAAAEDGA